MAQPVGMWSGINWRRLWNTEIPLSIQSHTLCYFILLAGPRPQENGVRKGLLSGIFMFFPIYCWSLLLSKAQHFIICWSCQWVDEIWLPKVANLKLTALPWIFGFINGTSYKKKDDPASFEHSLLGSEHPTGKVSGCSWSLKSWYDPQGSSTWLFFGSRRGLFKFQLTT